MKTHAIASGVVGLLCLALFTALLLGGTISEITYASVLIPLALLCIAIPVLPRLKELDLKNLRLVLSEIKQVTARAEQVKDEIVEMYGGIEDLQRQPMVLDRDKMKELGLDGGHLATSSAVIRFTAGCIKRERERLAKVFVAEKSPERLAQAILDNSLDDKVFKWNGPETPLDADPTSIEQREAEKDD